MKNIVKLEGDELLCVLIALLNEAYRLENLAAAIEEKESSREFSLQARRLRKLHCKILDTYESID